MSGVVGALAVPTLAAVAFLALARWVGEAPPLAIWGGAVWVFMLSTIVSLPLIRGRRRPAAGEEAS